MKKIKEIMSKKNLTRKGKDTGAVLLGLISATALAKGFDYLVEKYPEHSNALQVTKFSVLGGAGLVLTLASDDESFLEGVGEGLTAGTALEGIKMIPFVKENFGLSGIEQTYYTEEQSSLDLGNFGLNALPVASYQMQEAPTVKLELPELDGGGIGYNPAMNEMNGLGYNKSATDDTRIEGLGYNPAQTGDDLDGII